MNIEIIALSNTREEFCWDTATGLFRWRVFTACGLNTFNLVDNYIKNGMTVYVELVRELEFSAASQGYSFASSEADVAAGYFDDVTTVIQGGKRSVKAILGFAEEEQFVAV